MAWAVLAAWIVQGTAGAVLLARRGRGRRIARPVVHAVLGLIALACWIAFALTGAVGVGWIAFVILTVGNAIGDTMLVARSRRLHAAGSGGWGAYGRAIADTFHGRLPRLVTFHAVFSGVVYFGCLGVCIGASVAAA